MSGHESRLPPHPMDTVLGPKSEARDRKVAELIDYWAEQGLFPTLFATAEQNGTGKEYTQLKNVPFQVIAEARQIFRNAYESLIPDDELSVASVALQLDDFWVGHYGLNRIDNGLEWMGINADYDALHQKYTSTFDLGKKIARAHESGAAITPDELLKFQTELRSFLKELETLYAEKLGVPMLPAAVEK